MVLKYDPFKSDIYSLGLILLQIQLLRKGFGWGEVEGILKEGGNKISEQSKKNDINEFINRGSRFLSRKNEVLKLRNILEWMLEIEEINRVGSVRLGLICQMH